MQNRTLCLFVVICVVCSIVYSVSAGGGKGNKKRKGCFKTCGGVKVNREEAIKAWKDCKEKAGETSTDEKNGHRGHRNITSTCVDVCAWKTIEMLNKDGTYNEPGTRALLKKVYTVDESRDCVFKIINDAAANHASTFSMSDNCQGYSDWKRKSFEAHKTCCCKKSATSSSTEYKNSQEE